MKEQINILQQLQDLGFEGLAEDIKDPEFEITYSQAIHHIKSNEYMIDSEEDEEAFKKAIRLVTIFYSGD